MAHGKLVGFPKQQPLNKQPILPKASPVANYAFDVTPARLVSGLVTERGICDASRRGLASLYPERN